jgi:hypothetical protein
VNESTRTVGQGGAHGCHVGGDRQHLAARNLIVKPGISLSLIGRALVSGSSPIGLLGRSAIPKKKLHTIGLDIEVSQHSKDDLRQGDGEALPRESADNLLMSCIALIRGYSDPPESVGQGSRTSTSHPTSCPPPRSHRRGPSTRAWRRACWARSWRCSRDADVLTKEVRGVKHLPRLRVVLHGVQLLPEHQRERQAAEPPHVQKATLGFSHPVLLLVTSWCSQYTTALRRV